MSTTLQKLVERTPEGRDRVVGFLRAVSILVLATILLGVVAVFGRFERPRSAGVPR